MVEDAHMFIMVEEAASRLGKSPSAVRRDARAGRLNSIREGGRIWIRVDDRFLTVERNPKRPLPPHVDIDADANLDPEADPRSNTRPRDETIAELRRQIEELESANSALSGQLAGARARIRQLILGA